MDILAQIDEENLILLAEKKARLCGGTSVLHLNSRCRNLSVGVALSISELQIESCRSETKRQACRHMAMMHFSDHWLVAFQIL